VYWTLLSQIGNNYSTRGRRKVEDKWGSMSGDANPAQSVSSSGAEVGTEKNFKLGKRTPIQKPLRKEKEMGP